jgi:hypothetical protein
MTSDAAAVQDPRSDLADTVATIAARIPGEQEQLLLLPRFDAERDAVARLADPDWARLGAHACGLAEAGRLLDLIATRYGHLPGATSGAEPPRDQHEEQR